MVKKLLLFIGIVLANNCSATHVIGGTLTYDHLGGSTYHIVQRLYRYCSGPLPATMSIRVTNASGALVQTITAPLMVTNTVTTTYVCVTNPNICMDEGIYSITVSSLPPLVGGYHLYTQYCCRSASILNIQNPLSTGDSWNTDIPDANIWLQNSSPQWSNQPTIFVCVNQPLSLSFSAIDADGDSLVHSWYTPYTDATPTFPGNIATFTPISWAPGYGVNNQCGGPNWIINPTTGVVTGTPPTIGVYVIGVKVEEYRNGIKIGEIIRDYNFSVVSCGTPPVASFSTLDPICLGQTSNFNNTSVNAFTSFWDFGVISSSNDTTSVMSPSYLYTGAGTYIVTLIINPGQTYCIDTITGTVHVQICTTISEKEKPILTLSPNPANEQIYFTIKFLNEDQFQISVEDVTGKIIVTEKRSFPGNELRDRISISDLSPGIYLVKVKTKDHILTEKLLVN